MFLTASGIGNPESGIPFAPTASPGVLGLTAPGRDSPSPPSGRLACPLSDNAFGEELFETGKSKLDAVATLPACEFPFSNFELKFVSVT